MLHSPFRCCLAICLFACTVSPALAQRGFDPADPSGLIRRSKTIRTDLKVSESQLQRIEEAAKKAREEYQKAVAAATEKYRNATSAVAMEVLTQEQKKRLWSIQVQLMRSNALFNEKVQQDIGLNRSQREKLGKLKSKRDEARKLFNTRKSEDRKKASAMFREYQEGVKGILSESQEQRLERLKGEPVFQRRGNRKN
ncbi:MAG: hypothetical protein ACFCD0_00650 [Gemmataceae bacterium]